MKLQNRKTIYQLLYTVSFFSLGFIIGYGNFPIVIFWIFYWSWLITTLLGIIIGRKIERLNKSE